MNICFLMYHGSMYSGGQGIYLYYLTRELMRLGHEVRDLLYRRNDAPLSSPADC